MWRASSSLSSPLSWIEPPSRQRTGISPSALFIIEQRLLTDGFLI
jgi:hypothetical protein